MIMRRQEAASSYQIVCRPCAVASAQTASLPLGVTARKLFHVQCWSNRHRTKKKGFLDGSPSSGIPRIDKALVQSSQDLRKIFVGYLEKGPAWPLWYIACIHVIPSTAMKGYDVHPASFFLGGGKLQIRIRCIFDALSGMF